MTAVGWEIVFRNRTGDDDKHRIGHDRKAQRKVYAEPQETLSVQNHLQ